ncbi:hypothetical protein Tco_1488665, partial [Tanacetum coccineum]
MADDQPMWENNLAVAPTPATAIVAVDLGDNFTIKGHHLSMIKDRQFDGHSRTDPYKHIAEFVEQRILTAIGENGSLNNKDQLITQRDQKRYKRNERWMNKCEGPHPSSDCDDKPMGGPKEEEENYASGLYRGGYQGNYYGRNSRNWRDRQSHYRDENRNSNPNEENPPIPCLPKKKPDESEFKKTMREFVVAQKAASDFVKNQFYNLKTKVKQGQKNHQVAIQDLETNDKTYDPPVNSDAKPSVFLDDSKDKPDEVEKEAEPLPKKPTHADPSP